MSFGMKIKSGWNKHGALVLFVISQACAIATPILSAKATPKAMQAIEDYKEQHRKDFLENAEDGEEYIPPTKKELLKVSYKYYIPAAATGVTGVLCGGFSFMKEQAAVASFEKAFDTLSEKSQIFEDAVKENVSKDKLNKIKADVAEKELKNDVNFIPPVTSSEDGMSWFKDAWSKQRFRSNMETIRIVQNDINEILNNGEWVPLNEYYIHLRNLGCDVEPIENGWSIGWIPTAPFMNLKISNDVTQFNDGTPCGVLSFSLEPRTLKNA